MNKFFNGLLSVALVSSAAFAPAAIAATGAKAGMAIRSAAGTRLGIVTRVAADGAPQIIIDGRLITIPVNTVTLDQGKVVTSLTKPQVLALP